MYLKSQQTKYFHYKTAACANPVKHNNWKYTRLPESRYFQDNVFRL